MTQKEMKMNEIDNTKLMAFAHEVLSSSFGVCEISTDDIYSIGLRLGLLFEDEATQADVDAWNGEFEPGDMIYRIHANVKPAPLPVAPIGDLPLRSSNKMNS